VTPEAREKLAVALNVLHGAWDDRDAKPAIMATWLTFSARLLDEAAAIVHPAVSRSADTSCPAPGTSGREQREEQAE
jgi:hypothetical protein